MTPSISIREQAASLMQAAWEAEDAMVKAEDAGVPDDVLQRFEQACVDAWRLHDELCDEHGIEILTEASGAILRCAKTKTPLVYGDEYEETETGELVIVKQAA